jgi:hypothetical protein
MFAGSMRGMSARISAVGVFALVLLTGCGDTTDDGLSVGDDAPGFTLPEASGSTVTLNDFAGAPALLYFHMADG